MITLIIFLCFLSVSAHEFGHAFAMRRCGIQIKEISLLGIGSTLFKFKIRKMFGETPIVIKLFPFEASVKSAQKNYYSPLSYMEKVYVGGSGIIANVLYSTILYITALLYEGNQVSIYMYLLLLIGLILGLFPRIGVHFIFPFGILSLIIIIMILSIPAGIQISGTSKGFLMEIFKKYCSTFPQTLKLASILSLLLGLLQGLPCFPLDGGHIAIATIEKIFGLSNKKNFKPIFALISMLVLLVIFVWCILRVVH